MVPFFYILESLKLSESLWRVMNSVVLLTYIHYVYFPFF